MINLSKFSKQKNKGFTLIEVLVSLALFSIVLIISGGVIVSVIDINKRNQAIASVVNNLNYSIDSMIRDIKTGYLYKCDYSGSFNLSDFKNSNELGECINGKSISLISTISGKEVLVTYELVALTDSNSYIRKKVFVENGNNYNYTITDKNSVKIDDFNLNIKNPKPLESDDINQRGQPTVFVRIKGIAGNQEVEASKFFIQTFITQRLINLTDFKD